MNNEQAVRRLPSKWLMVFLLGSLTAFGPLSLDMYLPAFPNITKDLQTTASLTQLSLTACLIGMAFGQLVFGPLSDIQGRRKPLTFTLILYGIISIIVAFSPTITIFIVLRVIQGFTGAAGIVIARATASDMYKGTDLTKFMALLSLIMGAAPILAPILGGIVLQYAAWPAVFYVLGMIGFVVFIAVFFLFPETLPPEQRSQGNMLSVVKTFGTLLKDQVFMGIAGTQAFVMSSMFAYIAGSSFVLQNYYEVSPQQFSLVFALNGVGLILASQLTGRLANTVQESSLLRAGILSALSGAFGLVLVLSFHLPLPLFIAALFVAISSGGIVSTSAFSLAMARQGRTAGSASAFLGLLPFIGGALVAPLVGLFGDSNPWPMVVVMLSCLLGAATLYVILIQPAIRQLHNAK